MPNLANPNALLPGYARIHYFRPDGNYPNWTVYAFNDTAEYTGDFNDGLTSLTSYDSYGAYFDISLIPNAKNLGFIIHNISTGCEGSGSGYVSQCRHESAGVGNFGERGGLHNDTDTDADSRQPAECVTRVLAGPPAHRDTVAVCAIGRYVWSSFSTSGGLSVTTTGITGGTTIPLTVGGTLTTDELMRYPQLAATRYWRFHRR